MGEVMRVLEGSLAPMFCVTDTPDRDVCAFEDHCGTRVLWARVRDGINMALDATTLADLLVTAMQADGASAPPCHAPDRCRLRDGSPRNCAAEFQTA